jgi:hypothetical protein
MQGPPLSDARGVASRVIRLKVLKRFVGELQGSVEGKSPAAKAGSGKRDLHGWGFLLSIREGDLGLDGEAFREGKSMWNRDDDLVAVRGFRLGKLEGVDSPTRRRRNVGVLIRGGKKGGSERVRAGPSSSGFAVMGGAHGGG